MGDDVSEPWRNLVLHRLKEESNKTKPFESFFDSCKIVFAPVGGTLECFTLASEESNKTKPFESFFDSCKIVFAPVGGTLECFTLGSVGPPCPGIKRPRTMGDNNEHVVVSKYIVAFTF
uniref:DAGKc domain-containing protein n=1 Tax=Steinernema glaseri TaxID=37863 RepID=A0A1I7XXU3_9BILA